jgi:hypothetical protein
MSRYVKFWAAAGYGIVGAIVVTLGFFGLAECTDPTTPTADTCTIVGYTSPAIAALISSVLAVASAAIGALLSPKNAP